MFIILLSLLVIASSVKIQLAKNGAILRYNYNFPNVFTTENATTNTEITEEANEEDLIKSTWTSRMDNMDISTTENQDFTLENGLVNWLSEWPVLETDVYASETTRNPVDIKEKPIFKSLMSLIQKKKPGGKGQGIYNLSWYKNEKINLSVSKTENTPKDLKGEAELRRYQIQKEQEDEARKKKKPKKEKVKLRRYE